MEKNKLQCERPNGRGDQHNTYQYSASSTVKVVRL